MRGRGRGMGGKERGGRGREGTNLPSPNPGSADASRRISGRRGWAGLAVAVSCPFLFNRLFYEVFVIKLPIKINRRISLGLRQ